MTGPRETKEPINPEAFLRNAARLVQQPLPQERKRTFVNPREAQRQAVFDLLPDEQTRAIMTIGVPSDTLRPYGSLSLYTGEDSWRRWDPKERFGELVVRQVREGNAGDFYRHLFALALSSQNPVQLANAFGALSAILEYRDSNTTNSSVTSALEEARRAFLQSTTTPENASQVARDIAHNFSFYWNYSQTWGTARSFLSKFSEYVQPALRQKSEAFTRHLLEAYVLAILDQRFPLEMRDTLLAFAPLNLHFGAYHSYKGDYKVDPIFSQQASIWQQGGASWIYPHLKFLITDQAALRGEDLDTDSLIEAFNVSQSERAELRSRASNAESELMVARQEIERLSTYVARLLGQLGVDAQGKVTGTIPAEVKEVVYYYKEFGGYPLQVTGVAPVEWANKTPEERERLTKEAYRKKVRNLHYNVVPTDPNYDPVKADLANQAFSHLTNAYKYLLENLNRRTFPDATLVR